MAGNFHSDVGRRAAEDRVLGFRTDLEAAKALKVAMTRRKPPAAASSVVNRASQVINASDVDESAHILSPATPHSNAFADRKGYR